MSQLRHQPQRSFTGIKLGGLLFVRWLLLVVIALDLVSSPLHLHHHEGGPEGYALSTHVDQLDADSLEPVTVLGHVHVHGDNGVSDAAADKGSHGGHSMSALQVSAVQFAVAEPASGPMVIGPMSSLALLLGHASVQEVAVWRPERDRVPIPLFRTLPPDGRAPPQLRV